MSVNPLEESRRSSRSRKHPRSPKIGRAMVANLRPGKWYSAEAVADKAGVTERDVHSVLKPMCWPSRTPFGARAEKKRVGKEVHYRIFKKDKTVGVQELTTKLRPIVEGLKAEGKKNMATMVPAEVAMLAARLERLLNEWAGVARGAAKLAVEGVTWYDKNVEGLPAPKGDDVYTLFGKTARSTPLSSGSARCSASRHPN
jgi:hypothetical protein